MSARHALEDVELALRNRRWEFEQILPYPDSLFAVTRRFVEQNPNFDGCCIAMLPDYYPEKGRLFEPYTVRRGEVIETYQLGSEEHDYSKTYISPFRLKKTPHFGANLIWMKTTRM